MEGIIYNDWVVFVFEENGDLVAFCFSPWLNDIARGYITISSSFASAFQQAIIQQAFVDRLSGYLILTSNPDTSLYILP